MMLKSPSQPIYPSFVSWLSFPLTNPEPSGESTGELALECNNLVEQGGIVVLPSEYCIMAIMKLGRRANLKVETNLLPVPQSLRSQKASCKIGWLQVIVHLMTKYQLLI